MSIKRHGRARVLGVAGAKKKKSEGRGVRGDNISVPYVRWTPTQGFDQLPGDKSDNGFLRFDFLRVDPTLFGCDSCVKGLKDAAQDEAGRTPFL